jgi:uncharacterized protein YhbP (UPF0306 family)
LNEQGGQNLSTNIRTLKKLKNLFNTQKVTTLASQEEGHPYLSLMAFAMTDDLNHMVMATKRGTRKYSNMIKSPGVAFQIDNRNDERIDFLKTISVTGIGKAEETTGEEKYSLTGMFLKKHPELTNFVNSPECAVFKINIEKFIIISHFEEAEEVTMV